MVRETTRVLKKAFKKVGPAELAALVVVAQQHYLYLETAGRLMDVMPGLIPARFGKSKGPPRTPLGRMVWTGDPRKWRLQLYKWSDECWDEGNDAGMAGGTPEECITEAVLGWGA
jgi:hypothetical protein